MSLPTTDRLDGSAPVLVSIRLARCLRAVWARVRSSSFEARSITTSMLLSMVLTDETSSSAVIGRVGLLPLRVAKPVWTLCA